MPWSGMRTFNTCESVFLARQILVPLRATPLTPQASFEGPVTEAAIRTFGPSSISSNEPNP